MAALAAEKRKREMALKALSDLRCLAMPASAPLRHISEAMQDTRGPSDLLLAVCLRQAAAMEAKAGALVRTMSTWVRSHERLFQGLPVATWREKMEAVPRSISAACNALRAASILVQAHDVIVAVQQAQLLSEEPAGVDLGQAGHGISQRVRESRRQLVRAREHFIAARIAALDALIASKELLELF